MQDYYEDSYTSPGEAPRGLRQALALYVKWGGAAVSITLIGLFVLWAYRLGVRDATEIPVIQALDGPIRVQPEDPGGHVAQNQGLEVNEILAGEEAQSPREPQLAPATLQLSIEDTPAEPIASLPAATIEQSGNAALSEAPDDPLAEVDAQDTEPAQETRDIAALVASVTDGVGTGADPAQTGLTLAVRPRARAADLASLRVTPQPEVEGTVQAGTLMVQLGAFDSRDIAGTQWDRLLSAHGDLLGTRERFVQQAESNGRVFYRLRLRGFENRTDQRALCEALGARDVDCIPVTAR